MNHKISVYDITSPPTVQVILKACIQDHFLVQSSTDAEKNENDEVCENKIWRLALLW